MKKLLLATTLLSLSGTFSPFSWGETLRIALNTPTNTFDPHMTASVGTDLSVLSHIYPALILRDAEQKLQPELATSWQAVDNLSWRITLRPGAHFTNGEPIDASTVKWNLDRVTDAKVKARISSWFANIAAVEVVSPTELLIKTNKPFPALPAQLSMLFLLPPKWAATHDPAKETLSGGRYILSEYVPGNHITLKSNPDYWGEKSRYDSVVFTIIPEASSRIAALLAGEEDLITGIPPAEIERINKNGRATAGAIPSNRSVFIKFNTTLPPLDNKEVRQALNYAIDKQGIAKALFNGLAPVSQCQILTPGYSGFNPQLKAYDYNPEKARELLKKSGIDLKQTIEMDLPVGTYLQGNEVVQIVAAQLAEVGLNIKINEMEFSTYMNKYLKSRTLAQTSLLTHAWPTLEGESMLKLLAPGNIYAYWDNAQYGDWLKKLEESADPAQRNEAIKQATALMCDEAPVLFLYTQPATYGESKRIHWQPRGDDWVRAVDVQPAS